MSESIKVHQADIHTAAVEVGILRISGKQVTLAVFRQLVEESPVDSDGHFVGLPWGTVNYHPPKECGIGKDDGSHFHVVWQKGSELRRGTLKPPVESTPWPDAAEDWLLAASAHGWRPHKDWLDKMLRRDTLPLFVRAPGGSFRVDVSPELRQVWREEMHPPRRYMTNGEVVQDPPRPHPDPPAESEAELLARVNRAVLEHQERHAQRLKRYEEVSALPQLFIAV